jgi:pimeloyl-ACP methyl ester carboxylesterase
MILEYKGINIFYNVTGQGKALILLHGFLEDHSMWNDAVPLLSKNHSVISIDLLGHGKTDCIGYVHTMPQMADAVKAVLDYLKVTKYIFIGHSMGGYVALDLAKRFTEDIEGLCLLNSTYEADDEKRKLLRTRANKMIRTNFKNMVRMSFANLFSAESKVTHQTEYEAALQIALNTSLQGYMAGQEGMKLRGDLSVFFAEASFKKIILLGEKDTVLNSKKMIQFTEKHNIKTHVFSQGHMSHIENKEQYLQELMRFVE